MNRVQIYYLTLQERPTEVSRGLFCWTCKGRRKRSSAGPSGIERIGRVERAGAHQRERGEYCLENVGIRRGRQHREMHRRVQGGSIWPFQGGSSGHSGPPTPATGGGPGGGAPPIGGDGAASAGSDNKIWAGLKHFEA